MNARPPMHTDTLDTLRRLLGNERIAMMSHIGPGWQIRSRPMTLIDLDVVGRFWFFCENSPVNAALSDVHLAFTDERSATYLSISGPASLVTDRARIEYHWTEFARPWFPQGPQSPDLALLCVEPDQIEVWDSPDNCVIRSLALLVSVIRRQPTGLGRHEVLDPRHPPPAH